jgi:hypothetical protein
MKMEARRLMRNSEVGKLGYSRSDVNEQVYKSSHNGQNHLQTDLFRVQQKQTGKNQLSRSQDLDNSLLADNFDYFNKKASSTSSQNSEDAQILREIVKKEMDKDKPKRRESQKGGAISPIQKKDNTSMVYSYYDNLRDTSPKGKSVYNQILEQKDKEKLSKKSDSVTLNEEQNVSKGLSSIFGSQEMQTGTQGTGDDRVLATLSPNFHMKSVYLKQDSLLEKPDQTYFDPQFFDDSKRTIFRESNRDLEPSVNERRLEIDAEIKIDHPGEISINELNKYHTFNANFLEVPQNKKTVCQVKENGSRKKIGNKENFSGNSSHQKIYQGASSSKKKIFPDKPLKKIPVLSTSEKQAKMNLQASMISVKAKSSYASPINCHQGRRSFDFKGKDLKLSLKNVPEQFECGSIQSLSKGKTKTMSSFEGENEDEVTLKATFTRITSELKKGFKYVNNSNNKPFIRELFEGGEGGMSREPTAEDLKKCLKEMEIQNREKDLEILNLCVQLRDISCITRCLFRKLNVN